MKILAPHCGAAAESTSGGEVYERELLSRMSRKVELRLVHALRGREFAPSIFAPVRYVTGVHWPRGLAWWAWPFAARTLAWAIREEKPDLLRAHSLRSLMPVCVLARKLAGRPDLPIVAHHHHLDGGPLTALDRWAVAHADRVVVGSRFAHKQLVVSGFRTGHVRVVPYGVDAELFTPRDPSQARLTPGFVVAVAGKARKGHDRLMRLWPRVEARVPGAGWVALRGQIPEINKAELLRHAAAFVTLSRLEGFGLAVAEAMASGLPVVALRDSGALPELLGDTALYADTDDEIVDAIVWALTSGDQRGKAGRERVVESFTWERCVAGTLAVYEGMVRR